MKDWKGNSKAFSSMLGVATKWKPEEREQNDYYATDPQAVRLLMEAIIRDRMLLNDPYIPIDSLGSPRPVFYECACGAGNISKELEAMGYKVYSTDLVDRGYGTAGIDFLSLIYIPSDISVIMTNPPYKYATEFILHALDLLHFGQFAIFLLNINYLAGLERYNKIYKYGSLYRVYVHSKRVNCYKNNDAVGHNSPINYGWFVFRKGFQGDATIRFL